MTCQNFSILNKFDDCSGEGTCLVITQFEQDPGQATNSPICPDGRAITQAIACTLLCLLAQILVPNEVSCKVDEQGPQVGP